MKILKLIVLAIIVLSQISFVSAMNKPYTETSSLIYENVSCFPQKIIGLNEKYKNKIKEFLIPELANIVIGYADWENGIRENDRLYHAMSEKNIRGMKQAIENGANVNFIMDFPGEDPLIRTIKILSQGIYDPVEIKPFIKYLIGNGADLKAQDIDGHTALMLAIKTIYSNYIITKSKDVDFKKIASIVVNDNLILLMQELIDLLLKNKANLNLQNQKGQTALMFAALSGDGELVRKLINHGAHKNIPDNSGKTAYVYAKNAEIEEILYPKALSKEEERKEIKQQCLQREEQLQRQQEAQRLVAPRAQEALAQVAAQQEEHVWTEEPGVEESWGEFEQED